MLAKELIRLVDQYSVPWEEKGEILKKLRNDYMTKQKQLLIAVKHLEMVSVEVQCKRERGACMYWLHTNTIIVTLLSGRSYEERKKTQSLDETIHDDDG